MGSLCFVCDLCSHSETAHGKSRWIHQKEQKNYPWHFPNRVVGFSLGLSNYKSSGTNQVEEKSKSGNCSTCSTCWAHFCDVALKLGQGTYQIQYTWRQTWLFFEVHTECISLVLCSKYPLVQFLFVRHSFLTGQVLLYKKQKKDRKQAIRFAICDLHDKLNFPPNTARSKVVLG